MRKLVLIALGIYVVAQFSYVHNSVKSSFKKSSGVVNVLSTDGKAKATVAQIPRTLHYIWPNKNFSFGDDDPSNAEQGRTLALVQRIKASNPDWEVKIWTDDECYALVREYFPDFYPIWKSLSPRLKMWDAVRPVILYVHGGIYLDHDIDCDEGVHFSEWIGSPTTLLLRAPTLRRTNRRGIIKKQGNHFMGSAKNHPIWKLYMDNIVKDIPKNYTEVDRHTGPEQLYPTFQEYVVKLSQEERSRVRLLGLHEFDMAGECEEAAEYEGFCAQPRCSHMHSVSPAELAGEDHNPEKQVKAFRERIANIYPEAKCACSHLTSWLTESRLVVDKEGESLPVVFVHVPRTGGTTIQHLMHRNETCHATASDLVACKSHQYETALSFAALRNPIDRALSLYRYALSGGNGEEEEKKELEWVQGKDFADFVKKLPEQRKLMFAPQSHFITRQSSSSSLLVDEIMCTEDLEGGWARIKTFVTSLKELGDFPADPLRASSSASNFDLSQIDEATKQRLREFYHDDFRLWEEYCSFGGVERESEKSVGTPTDHMAQSVIDVDMKRRVANDVFDCDGEGSPCNYFYPASFYDSRSGPGYSHRAAAQRQLYSSQNRTFHANWIRFTPIATNRSPGTHDFTYVHIRKAGGSSVKMAGLELASAGGEFGADVKFTQDAVDLVRVIGEKGFAKEIKKVVNETTLFTFVRDPFSRFCSAVGHIAGTRRQQPTLSERDCLAKSIKTNMKCVLAHLKKGDLVNEHLTPATIELYQMVSSLPHVPVAVMPMRHLNSFMKTVLRMKPFHANAAASSETKEKYSCDKLDQEMIRDICIVYETDVHMMRSVGIAVPRCDEYVPRFATDKQEEAIDDAMWPKIQRKMCYGGVPRNLETVGPLLFSLALDELAGSRGTAYPKKDGKETSSDLVSQFFQGFYGKQDGSQSASLYTKTTTVDNASTATQPSVVYVRIWKSGDDQIRHIMNETAQGSGGSIVDRVSLGEALDISGKRNTSACVVTAVRDPISHFLSGYNEVEYRKLTYGVRPDHAKFERFEIGSRERFKQFVFDMVRQKLKRTNNHFVHVFPQSRVLAALETANSQLKGYLPSISSLNTDWPKFLRDACPGGIPTQIPPQFEQSRQHESYLDKDGFYQAAKDVWAEQGPTAKALCVLHAMDYACWQDLPDGIPRICKTVFASDRFVSAIVFGDKQAAG